MVSVKPAGQFRVFLTVIAVAAAGLIWANAASAQVTAFKQAVAESAADDRGLAAFYRDHNYQTVWTGAGQDDKHRRVALFQAMANADLHGLPVNKYTAEALIAQLRDARSSRARGFAEVAMSKAYLELATDMHTGVLVPGSIDDGIQRQVQYREASFYLAGIMQEDPREFMRSLSPQSNDYKRLMKAKLRLEGIVAQGGWGPAVPAKSLKPGAKGEAVVALRNRLMRMGFMQRSAVSEYDGKIQKAVQQFQQAHGLEADGIAGPGTVDEINVTAENRLKSVIVSMERERWIMRERGKRHVMVNLTDFHARIIDDGDVTFMTRSVVGKNIPTRRSPEFSDVMEHLVINPTWNVPRSIAVREYLPMMKKNPNAAGHLRLIGASGRAVSREGIDFTQFTASNFPFDLKQPPSTRNALGLVKFMFPNKHNIYLHDTPAKKLFAREQRAFSHGCIRLQQPFEFAYEILSRQESDPKSFFHDTLDTGRETQVDLDQHIPVHIIYRTAFTNAKGPVQFRRDVYGRDAKIWDALSKAGVSLSQVQG